MNITPEAYWTDTTNDELYEEIESRITRVCPPDEYGENEDLDVMMQCVEELRRRANMKSIPEMQLTSEIEKIVEQIFSDEAQHYTTTDSSGEQGEDFVCMELEEFKSAANVLLKAQGLFTQEDLDAAYKKGAEVGWDACFQAMKDYDFGRPHLTKPEFLTTIPPYKQ